MRRIQDELLEEIQNAETQDELDATMRKVRLSQFEPPVLERLVAEADIAFHRISRSRISASPPAAPPTRTSSPADPHVAEILASQGPGAALQVQDAAATYNVPPNCLLYFVGSDGIRRPYITKEGLQILVEKKGKRAVETTSSRDPDKPDGWIAEAKIYPEISDADRELLERILELKDREAFLEIFRELTRPTIAHATAAPDNVKLEDVRRRLPDMAETRAFCRAARIYTGLGIASAEDEATPEG
jgi:hypothetical protein